jgi:hypothetical protein
MKYLNLIIFYEKFHCFSPINLISLYGYGSFCVQVFVKRGAFTAHLGKGGKKKNTQKKTKTNRTKRTNKKQSR